MINELYFKFCSIESEVLKSIECESICGEFVIACRETVRFSSGIEFTIGYMAHDILRQIKQDIND